MATTTAAFLSSPSLFSLSFPTRETCSPIFSLKRISSSKNPTVSLFSRSRISPITAVGPKCGYNFLAVSALLNGNSEAHDSNVSKPDSGDTIDIKLPRRSLLVEFTCNECGERTKRLINRLAYERGLVFVQCAGCLRHHKLIDNLGLIVEYDFREEINVDSDSGPI